MKSSDASKDVLPRIVPGDPRIRGVAAVRCQPCVKRFLDHVESRNKNAGEQTERTAHQATL